MKRLLLSLFLLCGCAHEPPRIDHILVEVTDLDRSIAFYRDLVGLRVVSNDGEFAMLRAANQGVFLWKRRWDWEGPVVPGSKPGLGMYPHFAVPDVRAFMARAKDRGVPIVRDAKVEDFGTEAFVADPDGYTWAIIGPR